MGSKLVVILDDLLWVLTDSQLKAALHFLDSLAGLVQKATLAVRKTKAARKLEVSFIYFKIFLILKFIFLILKFILYFFVSIV